MSDFEPIDFTSIDDIPGINAKALFSSELSKTEFRETGDISPVPIGDKHRYMPWGADDQLPYDILELIERDETLSTCQMFNAEICYGSGLLYNTEACSEKSRKKLIPSSSGIIYRQTIWVYVRTSNTLPFARMSLF